MQPMRRRILVWTLLTAAALPGFAGRGSAQPSQSEEQSCRAYVQKFYDWYWNRFADKADDLNFDLRQLPSIKSVLERRPAVFDERLRQLLHQELKQNSDSDEMVGNLDFDPFLNSQDPRGKYIVGKVRISGGQCEAKIAAGNEVAVLKSTGTSWVFANFLYGDPDASGKAREKIESDLVQLLSR